MDYKKAFEKFKDESVFIKTTSPKKVDGPLKAALNRKGNQLYNSGNIEAARRVFMTTGYSDGLSRVGDHYKSKDRIFDALRMYLLAPDRAKSEPIFEQMAQVLQGLLQEDEEQEPNEQ